MELIEKCSSASSFGENCFKQALSACWVLQQWGTSFIYLWSTQAEIYSRYLLIFFVHFVEYFFTWIRIKRIFIMTRITNVHQFAIITLRELFCPFSFDLLLDFYYCWYYNIFYRFSRIFVFFLHGFELREYLLHLELQIFVHSQLLHCEHYFSVFIWSRGRLIFIANMKYEMTRCLQHLFAIWWMT